MTMKNLGVASLLAVALFAAAPTKAQEYQFTFLGTILGQSAELTGDFFINSSSDITSITGTLIDTSLHVTAGTITGLATPPATPMLFPTSTPFLNSSGVSFTVLGDVVPINGDTFTVNVSSTGSGYVGDIVGVGSADLRGTLTAVPEPGTCALMLGGLGLVGVFAGRRRR